MRLFYPKVMRRHLIHIPIVIVTFAVSLLVTPYDAVDGLRGVFSRAFSVSNTAGSRNSLFSDHYGYWGGSGENVIELRDTYIKDVEKGKMYAYNVIREFRYPNGEIGCLIEVIGLERGSNLRKYVYLGANKGQLDYFGYDSTESYDLGRPSASGSFSRVRPEIIRD